MFTIKVLSKSYYAYVESTPKEELPDGHVLLVDEINKVCNLDAFITIVFDDENDIEYLLDNVDDIFNAYVENVNNLSINDIYKKLGR